MPVNQGVMLDKTATSVTAKRDIMLAIKSTRALDPFIALTCASNQRSLETERVSFLTFRKSLKLSQPHLKFSYLSRTHNREVNHVCTQNFHPFETQHARRIYYDIGTERNSTAAQAARFQR